MSTLGDSLLGNSVPTDAPAPAQSRVPTIPLADQLLGTPTVDQAASRHEWVMREGAAFKPEYSARVLRAAEITGLDPSFVRGNLDKIEANVQAWTVPQGLREATSPMSQFIGRNPYLANLTLPDYQNLGTFSRIIGEAGQSFQRGRDQVESSDIGWRAMLGADTPEDRKRMQEIADRQNQQVDYGFDDPITGILGTTAEQVPVMFSLLLGQGKWAAAGAASGAAVGGAAGAIAGGPAGVPAGALMGGTASGAVGWRVGASFEAMKMEGGAAYAEMQGMKDSDGNPLDRKVMVGAALMVGAVNAGLESVGYHTLTKFVPGLNRVNAAFSRTAVQKILASASMKELARTIGVRMAEAAATEGTTEFLQEMVSQSAEQVAAMASNGELDKLTPDEIAGRIFNEKTLGQAASAGLKGAQAGVGFTAASHVAAVPAEARRIIQAEKNGKMIEAIGEAGKNTQLGQKYPEGLGRLVRGLTADGPIKDIYMSVGKWNEYWQGQGLDPEEAAREATGSDAAYQQAAGVGDLVIPLDRYAAIIARGPHHEGLSEDIRFAPEQMSGREAKVAARELDKEHQRLVEAAAKGEPATLKNGAVDDSAQVEADLVGQLMGTGMPVDVAEQNAKIAAANLRAMASLSGDPSLTPMKLYERYGMTVARPLPDVLTKLGKTDALDVLLNKLRSGDSPLDRTVLRPEGFTSADIQRRLLDIADRMSLPTSEDMLGEIDYGKALSFSGPIPPELARAFEGNPHLLGSLRANVPGAGGLDTYYDMGHDKYVAMVEKVAAGQAGRVEEISKILMGRGTTISPDPEGSLLAWMNANAAQERFMSRKGGGKTAEVAGVRKEMVATKTLGEGDQFTYNGNPVEIVKQDGSLVMRGEKLMVPVDTVEQMPVDVGSLYKAGPDGKRTLTVGLEGLYHLRQMLGEAGIDVGKMTNEEIRAKLGEQGLMQSPKVDQTQTPEFKRWFGESKVVDKDGKPLVVYHGTPGDVSINQFSLDHANKNDPDIHVVGFHFSESREDADAAGRFPWARPNAKSSTVTAAYLSIKNPATPEDVARVRRKSGAASASENTAALKLAGYDGVEMKPAAVFTEIDRANLESGEKVNLPDGTYLQREPDGGIGLYDEAVGGHVTSYENLQEYIDQNPAHYVAFSPEQIKSAIGNRGTFDAGDPNILYQTAFHGSPHEFEKFTTAKIGTGEGAQAFGWGLYFSSSKDVAKHYRSGFTGHLGLDRMFSKAVEYLKSKGISKVEHGGDTMVIDGVIPDDYASPDAILSAARKSGFDPYAKPGHLYTVDLAPAEDHYLLWDKPLSEQSDYVQEKLRSAGLSESNFEKYGRSFDTGEDVYRGLEYLQHQNAAGKVNGVAAKRAASEALLAAGIPGIKYLDGSSRGDGEGSYNYVIFDENHVKTVAYEQSPAASDPFGRILFSPGNTRIEFFRKANLSTFLHEWGHFSLEVMRDLAESPTADPGLKADFEKVLAYLDAKPGEGGKIKFTTEHHEKWAKTFEVYLAEGKAPSAELRGPMARIRGWLMHVYSNIRKQLGVDLNPEISGVMDRMLATEVEITKAEQDQGVMPVFTDAKTAGWTPEQFREYQESVLAVKNESRDQVLREVGRQVTREQTALWREERDQVREEVAKQVNAQPVYQARDLLSKGRLADGTIPEGWEPVKLDRGVIKENFGEGIAKKLMPHVASKGGIHPDDIAGFFGYESGQELVLAMVNARKREDLINAEADVIMRQRHGDILVNGEIANKAAAAVANTKRGDLLVKEVQALAKYAGGRVTPSEILARSAEKVIARTSLANLNPEMYKRAGARAAREAFEAAASGNYATAFEAKQRELLNHHLLREAMAAREQADTDIGWLRSLTKKPVQARIGKAGNGYLEQINALLERFDLAPISNKAAQNREALAAWIERIQNDGATAGEEIGVPPDVLNEATRKSYKQLTVEEFAGLVDTVKQVKHLAEHEGELLAAEEKAQWQDRRGLMLRALKENYKDRGPGPLTPHGKSVLQKLTDSRMVADAALLKMEQLVNFLDGGDTGPWHDMLWNPVVEAQNRENDMRGAITKLLNEAVSQVPMAIRRKMSDRVFVEGINRDMVRRDLIGIALNAGNESNYNKMLRGMGWTPETVQKAVDQLSPGEIAFVNQVHKSLASMWPEIAKLQRELTGLEPPKVEPRSYTAAGGTIEGGYYPVMYEAVASRAGAMQMGTALGALVSSAYVKATTVTGYIKDRKEGYSAPMDFNVDRLGSHIAGMVHDLTHRKWLKDANRVLADTEILGEIGRRVGKPYVDMIRGWVGQVANGAANHNLSTLSPAVRVIEQARFNLSVYTMGFKVATVFSQVASVGNAIEVIGGNNLDGAKWLTYGAAKFYSNPVAMQEMVTTLSGEMRHRLDTINRDFRKEIGKLDAGPFKQAKDLHAGIQEFSLHAIGIADAAVSLPTWLGAYHKALSQGHDAQEAIYAGDRAVRLSQGASGSKDLAAIASRNDVWARAVTMYYTPFSALYSRLRSMGHDVGSAKDLPKLAARAFFGVAVAAILGELASGHGPKDDEDWRVWMAKTVGFFPTLSIPLLRDIVGAASSNHGYSMSPLSQPPEALVRTLRTAGKVLDGEKAPVDLAYPAAHAAFMLAGMPAKQLEITGEYLADVNRGDENPDSFGAWLHGMLYQRPMKK